MRNLRFLVLIGQLFLTTASFAADKKAQPEEEAPAKYSSLYQNGPEFEIDSNMVDKIYKKSVDEPGSQSSGSSIISAQINLVTPIAMSLENSYYDVTYTDDLGMVPRFAIEVTPVTYQWDRSQLALVANAGYGYKDEIIHAQSKTGVDAKDSISLQWLPIYLGLKTSYQSNRFRPHFTAGAGSQHIRQTGTLDGISQSFWIPFYIVSGGVTLFDQSKPSTGGFSGVTTGASYSSSLNKTQKVNTWSLDLGASVAM